MKNITMDNQQETLIFAYIAGLMDGEGTFSLYKMKSKNGYQIRTQISMSNTDLLLVNYFRKFCEHYQLCVYTRTINRPCKLKTQYETQITKLSSKKKFCELIIPYLIGLKKQEAIIMLEYINNRIEKNLLKNVTRDNKGRFIDNCKATFDSDDEKFYLERLKIRGSSETLRKLS